MQLLLLFPLSSSSSALLLLLLSLQSAVVVIACPSCLLAGVVVVVVIDRHEATSIQLHCPLSPPIVCWMSHPLSVHINSPPARPRGGGGGAQTCSASPPTSKYLWRRISQHQQRLPTTMSCGMRAIKVNGFDDISMLEPIPSSTRMPIRGIQRGLSSASASSSSPSSS